jgi:hypothetical protein
MALDYVWEKLYTAVNILATGQGTIQERLGSAYADSLIRLRGEELPDEIRSDFDALEKALTRAKAEPDEGTIAATMRTMESDEASCHAQTIVDMFDVVAKMDPQSEYRNR